MRPSHVNRYSERSAIRSLQELYARSDLNPTELSRLSHVGRCPIYSILINSTNDNPTLSVMDKMAAALQASALYIQDRDIDAVKALLAKRQQKRAEKRAEQ